MKLYGIFIGINDYADSNISNLSYAKADAEQFYELIKSSICTDEFQLKIFTDNQATKKNIVKAIGEDLSRMARRDDVVLLFFAGHGSPETMGSIDNTSRYFILHDTDYENIFSTAIDMERELPLLCFERIRSKLIVVFMDACFSGRSGGRTFEGPHLLKTRLNQGIRGAIQLNQLKLGEGRIIITASDDDELARESSELQHGLFSYCLMETLADRSISDKAISIPMLYNKVAEKVVAYSKNRQHPVMNGRNILGQLPMLISPKFISKD